MMLLGLTGKDILALTNESKRKAVLSGWQNWGYLAPGARNRTVCVPARPAGRQLFHRKLVRG